MLFSSYSDVKSNFCCVVSRGQDAQLGPAFGWWSKNRAGHIRRTVELLKDHHEERRHRQQELW